MKDINYDIIVEGKARIAVPKHSGRVVSSAMPVFYNPVMKSNRDITLLLLAAAAKMYGIKRWRIADPMAATGVRGIRMMLEFGSSNIDSLKMNDYSAAAVALIKKNLQLNKVKTWGKVVVEQNEASKFLLNNGLFSYIDVDPFGYPGIFLDAAAKRIRHNGIIAITATDTSALAGSAIAACQRKYLAKPLKNGFMHETGLRIMIRLAQLFGLVHEKALIPLFSYYKGHYARAFLMCKASTARCNEVIAQHEEIFYCGSCCEKKIGEGDITLRCSNCRKQMLKAGPLWAGNLFDTKLAKAMAAAAAKNKYVNEKLKELLRVVAEEAAAEGKCGAGFYAIEDVCGKHKIGRQPKTADVIRRLRQKGYAASPTHCSTTGVKTNAPVKGLLSVIWH